MQVDPQKSRQAHSQTGRLTKAAAPLSSQHQDSPNPCDLRGPQPASCRGGDAGQQQMIEFARATNDRAMLRSLGEYRRVPPIPPEILELIYAEDRDFNDNWTGASNAEVLIYALGAAILILGLAVYFA